MQLTTLTVPALPTLPTLAVSEEAQRAQADMLAASAACVQCTTTTEANTLAEAARDIRTHCRNVREMGLALRRPLTVAQSAIKRVEDSHCGPLEDEQKRLEGLAGAFHAQERARVQREEQARAAEIARLEADRVAAEALAREDKDNDCVQCNGTGIMELEDGNPECQLCKDTGKSTAGVALADAALNAAEAAMRAPKPAEHKPSGMTTRRVMRVEVTDIHALYKAAPHLVKLEANLAAIKATCFPEHPVAGLRLYYEDQTVTKRW